MSAVIQQQAIRLSLPATRDFMRTLEVELSETGFNAFLLRPGRTRMPLVYAIGDLANSRLDLGNLIIGRSLWIKSTCIEVTAAEAEAIASHFEPHGLRVLR